MIMFQPKTMVLGIIVSVALLALGGCTTYPYGTAFTACDSRAEACYASCERYDIEDGYNACQSDCGVEVDRCFDRAYASYRSGPAYSSVYYSPWYGRYGAWHPDYGYSFSVSLYNRYGYRRGVSRPGWTYYDPYRARPRYGAPPPAYAPRHDRPHNDRPRGDRPRNGGNRGNRPPSGGTAAPPRQPGARPAPSPKPPAADNPRPRGDTPPPRQRRAPPTRKRPPQIDDPSDDRD